MNNTRQIVPRSHKNRLTMLLAFLCTVAFAGLPLPASASITIDQAPLTVQNPLPPNIILMLDDSGSMAWDYMPDWDYLK
ncbi:MAG: hypothetical protein L0H29_04550, partial [Sinobacteraceae bacterium]|nr:hypothetical protein [Nevskiaceae bacterium]